MQKRNAQIVQDSGCLWRDQAILLSNKQCRPGLLAWFAMLITLLRRRIVDCLLRRSMKSELWLPHSSFKQLSPSLQFWRQLYGPNIQLSLPSTFEMFLDCRADCILLVHASSREGPSTDSTPHPRHLHHLHLPSMINFNFSMNNFNNFNFNFKYE